MKQILLFTLFLGNVLGAQSYYVGSPVYDTLVYDSITVMYSPNICPTFDVFFDPTLTQDPAGTQVYFKITSGTMTTGTLVEMTNGTFSVNDSFAVTPGNNAFQFHSNSLSNSPMHYAFIRCGTPTMVNDSFDCTQDIHQGLTIQVDGCGSVIQRLYFPVGLANCQVNGPLNISSSNFSNEPISFYPNPVTEKLEIVLPDNLGKITTIEVIDVMGRIAKTEMADTNLNGRTFELNLSGLVSGVYTVRVNTGNRLFSARVVKY